MKERFQWTAPIVLSTLDPKVLYVSSQHLWRSANAGQTWTAISPDLTRNDPSTLGPSGGPLTLDQTGVETYGTVFTIAPSHHDLNTIWAGSDDGLVNLTRNGGKSWQDVTPTDLGRLTRISLIETSPHNPATAYIAANRYQLSDRSPYVYKTTDYGHTWTKIVTGLPSDDFPRAIREDIVRPDLLYLGTERGVYVSLNGGDHWESLKLNLPVTPVHYLMSERNDLVMNPGVSKADVYLFKPTDPIRSISRGVMIDYFLHDTPSSLTLDILDGKDQVVRTFTGASKPQKLSAAEQDADEESGPPPPVTTVPIAKGVNRFTWDMRSSPAHVFPGLRQLGCSWWSPCSHWL